METVEQSPAREASLEALIETELLKVESLHPGGLELTEELAELCEVRRGSDVLELACGTGESACWLAERRGARVVGLDRSPRMIQRAEQKARARGWRWRSGRQMRITCPSPMRPSTWRSANVPSASWTRSRFFGRWCGWSGPAGASACTTGAGGRTPRMISNGRWRKSRANGRKPWRGGSGCLPGPAWRRFVP